ncbi:MAG: competence type IV pilus assembly protein ComGB [Lactovum sp.]
MKRLKYFLNREFSVLLVWKEKKLAIGKQIKFIELMNNLFGSGFSLTEIVDFLERSQLTEQKFIKKMRKGLENGRNLSLILSELQFSEAVVTQVSLAEKHGNISETLALIEQNLRKIEKIKKKLISVGTYPLVLLSFLVLILFAMRSYLIPQMSGNNTDNFAILIIHQLPTVFFSILLLICCLFTFYHFKSRKSSQLKKFQKAASFPFLSFFVKLYCTAYFSREWGILISQGLDLRQILEISIEAKSKIFSEVGDRLKEDLASGKTLHQSVAQLAIFNKELPLIIEYGEVKGKLGQELTFYSEESWEVFFRKIEQLMQLIQPLVFIFVAMAIVLIYAAMLMPIYQNINIDI